MAEKSHERSDAGVARRRFDWPALGAVADHEQRHRTTGFGSGKRTNERWQVFDGIEPGDGADHSRPLIDAELPPYTGASRGVRQRSDVDAVVDDVHLVGGEAFRDEMLLQLRRDRDDSTRRMREDAIRSTPLRRRPRIAQPPVFGEDDFQMRRPQPRDRRVDERRVMMAMDDAGVVLRG